MSDTATQRASAKPGHCGLCEAIERIIAGFNHVSGIARQWEPDHSTGPDRAKWANATEACADVQRQLRFLEVIEWIDPSPTTMPDADTVVLMELQGDGERVFAGSWDGEYWRWLDGIPVQCSTVTGWAHMPRGRAR